MPIKATNVDLNPVRAKIVGSLGKSKNTGIKLRMKEIAENHTLAHELLAPIAGFGVGVRGKIGLVTIAYEGQSPDAITAWRNAPGTRVELPASANGALHW